LNSSFLNKIYLGQSAKFEKIVDSDMIANFIKLSGDNNPIHTDLSYCVDRGFENIVVHGLLTSAFFSTLVGVYLPERNSFLRGIKIDFVNPVYPGDKLEVSGEVVFISLAAKQIEIKALVRNQNNNIVSRAKINVGIFDDG